MKPRPQAAPDPPPESWSGCASPGRGRVGGRPRAGPSLARPPGGKPFRAVSRLNLGEEAQTPGQTLASTVHFYKAGMWGGAQPRPRGYMSGPPPPGPVADKTPQYARAPGQTHVSPPLGPLPS